MPIVVLGIHIVVLGVHILQAKKCKNLLLCEETLVSKNVCVKLFCALDTLLSDFVCVYADDFGLHKKFFLSKHFLLSSC